MSTDHTRTSGFLAPRQARRAVVCGEFDVRAVDRSRPPETSSGTLQGSLVVERWLQQIWVATAHPCCCEATAPRHAQFRARQQQTHSPGQQRTPLLLNCPRANALRSHFEDTQAMLSDCSSRSSRSSKLNVAIEQAIWITDTASELTFVFQKWQYR